MYKTLKAKEYVEVGQPAALAREPSPAASSVTLLVTEHGTP